MSNPLTNIDSQLEYVTGRLIASKHPDAKVLLEAFLILKKYTPSPDKLEKLRPYLGLCEDALPLIEFEVQKGGELR